MEVQFGPNGVEEPNLLYKLQRKITAFNTGNSLPNRGYNLVTSSSKYGIVFVGSPDGTLSAYHLKDLVDKECEPKHFAVKLAEKPTHIAISCDEELLGVTGGQLLCVYKVVDFQNVNVSPAVTIKLDVNPSTFVSALQWNPCIPDSIAIAYFDGTLLVSSVSTSEVKKVQSKARCICWSPKGKQLVTGNSDGTLCQFKPDLTLAKNIPAPNLFEGAPVEALAIYWISTYQFAVVFRNASNDSRPAVTIVNTPKAGPLTCLNYEDICYSMGSGRPWFYYLQGLAQWNMILALSSNSIEIATLGSADGANWLQWYQTDEARPELPLTNKKQENYPVGVCINTCSVHQLPWGENDTLPFMPLLLVVSQSGVLTMFNMINLKKDAPQVCTPPQQQQLIALPSAALTSDIPDDAPAQVTLPAPTSAPKPQVQPTQQAPPQAVQPTSANISQGATMFGQPSAKPVSGFGLPQTAQAFGSMPPSQPPPEVKQDVRQAAPQVSAQVQPKPQSSAVKPQAAPEVNAALKAEQERVNKLKADQELRNMLVKEVNDFQMELYKFVVKSKEMQNKLQRDLNAIDANFAFQSLDASQVKRDCDLEELRGAVVQLKLDLVRACAVVAEARTHAEAKDVHQWTQVDPLTTKRVSTVKKLAYYVQTQLEQAHKALDYKWNEMIARDPQYNKPGQRMIRPILDDVYQPLVKQQEILSRQQAVLRTLRNTLKECDSSPMFKSTSLLRSTPFRNKDPLSKLTKNILNMSIESQTNKQTKDGLLTPQKLDVLRDMLSNHKPTKIKPVNVELRQHLAQMRISYQKSIKEKANVQETVKPIPVKTEPTPVQLQTNFGSQPKVEVAPSMKPVPHLLKQQSVPKQLPPPTISSFTPVNNAKPAPPAMGNVARTLFADDKPSPPLQQVQMSKPPFSQSPQLTFGFTPLTSTNPPKTASPHTRSMLKDMLMNKQTNEELNNDANTFMGQKICSPSAFASSSPQPQVQPTMPLTSKPISDINNMFNKFTQPASEVKPQPAVSKSQSSENKQPELQVTAKPTKVEAKKEEKSSTGLQIKPPLVTSTPNIPDVVKINNQATVKAEKSLPKVEAKPVANVTSDEPTKPTVVVKEEKSSEEKKTETPKPSKPEAKPPSSSASSIFATANANAPPSPVSTQPTSPTVTSTVKSPVTSTVTSATSIFANAAASQSGKTTQSGSIFSTSPTTTGAFGSTQGSIFGATTVQNNAASTTTTPAVQTGADSKPVVYSTPTPSSIFGSAVTTSPAAFETSASSIFAKAAASSPTTGFSTGSVFGTTPASTTSSVFGTTTTTETTVTTQISPTTAAQAVFGAATSTSPQSVFCTASTTTTPSVFGTTATSSPQSVFGAAVASSPQSVFGAAPAVTSQSVFGTDSTNAQAVFATATATIAQSIFGATTTTTQSVFGSAASPSVFGSAATTTQASVFSSPATTSQSVFGVPSTQASIFGSATTTQAPLFGGAQSTGSVFGTQATTQASVFGSTPSTQASVFGAPTQTTQASVFGSPPATTASGSLFGGTDNLFAAASISTTNASSPTSGGSIFGGGSSGSVFGGGTSSSTNIFGGKGNFSQTNPQTAAIFGGGGAAFGQQPAANTNTNFWAGGSNTTGTFGSPGFGQQATTQASSIFGGGTGGSFSAPSTGQPFGSPQQQTSVFGSPQQQTSPGFGGSAGFGQKAAFGQTAAFGSPTSGGGFGSFGGFNKSPSGGFGAPAAFGGGATFGGSAFGSTSPGKMFGGTAPAPNFGATQSNSTFETLATQNTLTFGNLAQQSSAPSPPAPSFNARTDTTWSSKLQGGASAGYSLSNALQSPAEGTSNEQCGDYVDVEGLRAGLSREEDYQLPLQQQRSKALASSSQVAAIYWVERLMTT